MRMIDADALIAFIRNQYFQCDMPEEWGNGVMWTTSQINYYCNKADTPTIEPKHGEWIYGIDEETGEKDCYPWTCSICGEKYPWYPNYCPHCGARMKGADDNRDYERAAEQREYDMLYESTYNPEDGSM